MNADQSTAPRPRRTKKIWLALVVVLVLIAAGGVALTVTCPCNRTPGLVLLGSMHEEPITDWSFANDVPLCQIQVWTSLGPRAMNLNCMASQGELYLSCNNGARKYWCGQVGQSAPARLRLNGVVYPVTLTRVLDEATLDRAWAARIQKLQVHGGGPDDYNPKPPADAPRPDHWWSFQVRSAATS